MFRSFFVCIFICELCTGATANASPLRSLFDCSAINESAERLKCFDNKIEILRSAENDGNVKVLDRNEMRRLEIESFGLKDTSLDSFIKRGDQSATPSLSAQVVNQPIASVFVDPISNKATIYLKNGQIWKQTDSRDISTNEVEGARTAQIRKAALGSYLMKIDSRAAITVKRIK